MQITTLAVVFTTALGIFAAPVEQVEKRQFLPIGRISLYDSTGCSGVQYVQGGPVGLDYPLGDDLNDWAVAAKSDPGVVAELYTDFNNVTLKCEGLIGTVGSTCVNLSKKKQASCVLFKQAASAPQN